MKRFYKEADVAPVGSGWQVTLDGRGIKTPSGKPQIVPARGLAKAMAEEWSGQSEQIYPDSLILRDLADFAIDVVAPGRAATIAALLGFAETDTLCYRAEPDDALFARQNDVWEPLLTAAEANWEVGFERISGVIHRRQPAATLGRLEQILSAQSDFALSGLTTLASMAASLVIALSAQQPGSTAAALWDAANLEEDWQADLWGKDAEAQALRSRKLRLFQTAHHFIELLG